MHIRALSMPSLLLISTCLLGCGHKAPKSADSYRETGVSTGLVSYSSAMETPSYEVATLPLQAEALSAPRRFIAERHKLEVVSRETDLQKNWDAVIKFCATIRCEVVSSSIRARTGGSHPSGAILLRVAPDDFPKLLTQVEKEDKVIEHTTESEDKTTEVVDTEARLKNLTAYRDSLRSMLGRPGLSIKDSIEIQEKLTDVQSDLDGETAKRKIQANATEKIAVEITFRVETSDARPSAFASLWRAFRESGETLAESLGSLVTFVVAVLPWLGAILLVGWLLRRLWRKRRASKAASGVSR